MSTKIYSNTDRQVQTSRQVSPKPDRQTQTSRQVSPSQTVRGIQTSRQTTPSDTKNKYLLRGAIGAAGLGTLAYGGFRLAKHLLNKYHPISKFSNWIGSIGKRVPNKFSYNRINSLPTPTPSPTPTPVPQSENMTNPYL